MEGHGVKDLTLMVLSTAIQAEALTEDQAMGVLHAMDNASDNGDKHQDKIASEVVPIYTSLTMRYVRESKSNAKN